MDYFDYIVVGAGSAGCVLARRLSDDPKVKVLLLEAGPPPAGFWMKVPAGMGKMFSANKFNWGFLTEPVAALNGRSLFWPRGKTLGGSSAINGMVFTRGNRRDYDNWAGAGNVGWGWEDVLPYFKRLEDNEHGANVHRGQGGPLRVEDPALKPAVVSDFVESAVRCGISPDRDLSVSGEEGVGVMQASIMNGIRQSTYDAYIAPVRGRENLTIRTDVHVTRVVFDGKVAVGVALRSAGEHEVIRASKEVVLSAGALGSPHLLMLSGVGERKQLESFGIATLVDLPGVGKNLQDHLAVNIKFLTEPRSSHNRQLQGWRKYKEGIRYLATRRGFLACGATFAAAFTRSHSGVDYADLDLGFRPITFSYSEAGNVTVDKCHGISVSVFVCRPQSIGLLKLKSADHAVAPEFHPNYLSAPADLTAMLAGLRQIRRIMASAPMASRVIREMTPGDAAASDEQLTEFIRATGKTAFHVCGTCRMGTDAMAVVDARLRVHGVSRLRLVDASVMPTVTSGNTNAPTIMIGEKGADMIKADADEVSRAELSPTLASAIAHAKGMLVA
jgi:choline dehydrogenase